MGKSIATKVLSGLGAVFLVGPVGGGIVGSLAGGYVGAVSGWGVHAHQLQRYQRLVEEGNVLVIIG